MMFDSKGKGAEGWLLQRVRMVPKQGLGVGHGNPALHSETPPCPQGPAFL